MISFLCLLIGISLNAQRGIEAGATIQPQIYGQFYSTTPTDRAVKIPYSFAIGVDAGYNFNDYFGLRSGFLYNPQGEKYNDLSTDPEQAYELNLAYIQIPLYLKINSNPENRLSFIFIAGPNIGFLNEATLTLGDEDPIAVLGEYERLVPGVAAGIGLQVNLDQGGNINFLWHNSASIDSIRKVGGDESRNISTGLQLAYHYFITW